MFNVKKWCNVNDEIKKEIKSFSLVKELGNARGNNGKQQKSCFEVHGMNSPRQPRYQGLSFYPFLPGASERAV